MRASKARTFYFYRSTIAPPSPFAPHTLANFKSLPKLIIAPPPPFEGSPRAGAAEYVLREDVHSHCRGDWQIALTKQKPLFIFIEARLRHIVGAIGKSPSQNKTSRTAFFILAETRLRHLPPFEGGQGGCLFTWQIALTKQNLSASLFYFYRSTIAPPPPF